MHATLCSILSDAVEGGFLSHNPAWRTYRYAGRKCEKKIADEETAQKIIAALEGESIKYETYFKLIIATGMRRGECCGLKWCDIDWEQRSIHICRNAVKVTDEEIFVKAPKTARATAMCTSPPRWKVFCGSTGRNVYTLPRPMTSES